MDAVDFFSPGEVIAAAKAIHRFRCERFRNGFPMFQTASFANEIK
jgi:hypothetical protein